MSSTLSDFDHLFAEIGQLSGAPTDLLLEGAGDILQGNLGMENLLDAILDQALQNCAAARGFILLDADGGRYHCIASRGTPSGNEYEPWKLISNTIVGRAIAEQRIIVSADAINDPQLAGIHSVQALSIQSVLCVPLVWLNHALGAIYLESTAGRFHQQEQGFLSQLADQVASILGILLTIRNQQTITDGLRREVQWLQTRTWPSDSSHIIVGHSAAIRELKLQASQVAREELSVLLVGETGTGKDLFAHWIHELSPRHNGPFIAVNCAAVQDNLAESELFGHSRGAYTGATNSRPGRIEQAEGGTLFLDEIGDMSPAIQAKMLRLLENKEYYRLGEDKPRRSDIRVVAATNRNLDELVQDNHFRHDLLFRLDQYRLWLPPLRERTEDVPALVQYILRQCSPEPLPATDDAALQLLQAHSWPGNVRELRTVLRRCLVGLAPGANIDAERVRAHLRPSPGAPVATTPSRPGPIAPLRTVVSEFERNYLSNLLQDHPDLSRAELAERLDLPLRTLQRKLRNFGLNRR